MMAVGNVQQRRLRTRDGVELEYHLVGQGPPVLIANALGADWQLWRDTIGYLGDRYRFITWRYRGLYGSQLPDVHTSVEIHAHASDARAILDAEGVERCAVIGWSFGVPVAVELFGMAPERVACLVMVNGVAGGFAAADRLGRWLNRTWPLLLYVAAHVPLPWERVARRVVGSPETMAWARRLGWVARGDEDDVLREAALHLVRLDPRLLRRMLREQARFDGRGLLTHIDVPTLCISGERDPFVTPDVMAHQAQRIPGSEFVVVPGATHYLPLDNPQFLNLRIEKFFQERGYPSCGLSWSSSAV